MAKYLVQHRRGTAAQWAEKDTLIPKEGEIVIEIDEVNAIHKLKIGDGKHSYAELAYLQAGDEIITQVLAQAKPRVVTITLSESWNQDSNGKYSQVVAIDNITKYSRLDLQPDEDMIAEFKQLGLVFVTKNNGGIISVYSVGNAPAKSYIMQATVVETECGSDKPIVGTPVGVSDSQSDWTQEDDTKSDYIKNKPMIASGTFVCNLATTNGNSVNYYAPLLSRTVEEIVGAFEDGRDVLIRMSTESTDENLGATTFPDIKHIEARVTNVYDGRFVARGFGLCSDPSQMYNLTISCNAGDTSITVDAYLYKSFTETESYAGQVEVV